MNHFSWEITVFFSLAAVKSAKDDKDGNNTKWVSCGVKLLIHLPSDSDSSKIFPGF